ncbi:uncharacterized protein Z518_01800 [Rhinocladiella mackenziei CBS 650.93]|uniref:Alpha/beta hydrolase fold-3 domain-containing protein n=1 Tax=Rhinocladiella mackenziei CBS 650.93 TaxID=1442369 RepID=A0A0D2J4R6_9EURO|nr:uncharacterized protein Z518_01800 [Rhinocladiella mackenziei CBS 650.93]KIX10716.1 hypothetical protein Z518_01800 [Rhinocladiella mackenziei CBS 650.93]
MDQTAIRAPEITVGTRYSFLYAVYLHATAAALRALVSYVNGRHEGFDKDLEIPTPGLGSGRVKVSVCLPSGYKDTAKDENPLPLVVVLEGGGFVLGQPKDGRKNDRLMADETGAVVISVDYAKSPRFEYPHALLQIWAVLKWALSKDATSEGLFVDPSRVAVLGNSAGGNLTAALSLLVSFTSGPCAQFRDGLRARFRQVLQVLIYPSVQLQSPYSERWLQGDTEVREKSLPIWAAEMMEASYLPPYIDKHQIFVAPLTAEVELLKQLRLPPALVINAGMDCLKYESRAYAEKLQQAGVNVSVREYPQAIHGFTHYKEGDKDYRKEDVEGSWREICNALKAAFDTPPTQLNSHI